MTALNDAIQLAKPLTPVTVLAAQNQLDTLKVQVQQGEGLLKGMLGIEKPAKAAIKESLKTLTAQKTSAERTAKFGAKKYAKLNLDPMTWRDSEGLPKLVIYSLKQPTFTIQAQRRVGGYDSWGHYNSETRTSVSISPKLPPVLAACYEDVKKEFRTRANKKNKTVRYTSTFQGIIPAEVKLKIHEALGLFDDVFIIGEPSDVKVTESAPKVIKARPNPDPLVVGWDGENLWLVAAFDTTPTEQAMALLTNVKTGPAN